MPIVSVTRLRLRSVRFLPAFALYTWRSFRQVRAADAFQGGSILADRRLTFWTMTVWTTAEAMRGYRNTGAHLDAMKYLIDWCDQASYVHWSQDESNGPEPQIPSWAAADQHMRAEGKLSKVRFPSPDHATLSYRAPRLATAGPIRPARP